MESGLDLYKLAAGINQAQSANSGRGVIANLFQNALEGAQKGQDLAKQDKLTKLLVAEKISEINKNTSEAAAKDEDLKFHAENRMIMSNFAKHFGLLDLDPGEQDHARMTSLDNITTTPSSTPTSGSGRLSSIYMGANAYKVEPHFSTEKGFSFDFKDPSADKPKDQSERNLRIRAAAEEAARREKFATISSLLGPEAAQEKFANVQPTEDEIEKYIPEISAFAEGDSAGAKKLKAKRSEIGQGNLETLSGLQHLIVQERNKGIGPFGKVEPGYMQGLVATRDHLLNGGDIATAIKSLAKDPVGNKAALKALAAIRIKQLGLGGK